MVRTLLGVLLLFELQPTFAGEYTFCLLMNRVASAGKLAEYSDRQIENGLCMVSKELVVAISTGDSLKEQVCMQSGEYMMREFVRRFPRRDPKSVIGRC